METLNLQTASLEKKPPSLEVTYWELLGGNGIQISAWFLQRRKSTLAGYPFDQYFIGESFSLSFSSPRLPSTPPTPPSLSLVLQWH